MFVIAPQCFYSICSAVLESESFLEHPLFVTLFEPVKTMWDMLLPSMIYADAETTWEKVHPSFTILKEDNTVGGSVIRELYNNFFVQLGEYLPIVLTDRGAESCKEMSLMLNRLSESQDFHGDVQLFHYLASTVDAWYTLNFDITSPTIQPFNSYSLPLKTKAVPNDFNSGVYGFFLDSPRQGYRARFSYFL
uniref:Uncharacterized protein n=1 Tax=Microbotryum cf. violaceum BFL-2013 TaxID=1288119 RepID=M1GLD9_9BASI|nr:hypothetical protein H888_mgp05 [Microbotryum cf. violaceum BFL-2013]AGE14653.1 hypothetical protein [Microbotryum cf. violaceum BFL-2013]